MSTRHAEDYLPTIIDYRPLLPRLATELRLLGQELRFAWPDFKQHPAHTTSLIGKAVLKRSQQVLLAPNVLAAMFTVCVIVMTVLLAERTLLPKESFPGPSENISSSEVTMLILKELDKTADDEGIGRNGKGRVGFQENRGEGSGDVRRSAQGGGGGGGDNPLPPQAGKLPPPSNLLASIPKTPPIHPPTLPIAGIDIDPALWKDLKAPIYGDPRTTSIAPSKGSGNGGGIGTNNGFGIGEGDGPGVGPGSKGNIGGNEKQTGCCGSGGSTGDGSALESPPIFRGVDVEQRAKLLAKPEPQYTEEARRNQITGTVMLQVVFSSSGLVEQIRAVQRLPFGLTERAIAAAKQIRFVPATKGGRAVSVYMQLEYNFNLY
jgi:TonB family protein